MYSSYLYVHSAVVQSHEPSYLKPLTFTKVNHASEYFPLGWSLWSPRSLLPPGVQLMAALGMDVNSILQSCPIHLHLPYLIEREIEREREREREGERERETEREEREKE